MKNWKIYLDNTLQKTIELKADFTGVAPGSHEVKIEAFNNSTLLDTDVKNVVVPADISLLLDNYPAAGAYSLRKLRANYTGPAIRVRRSSDNTEQNIGFISEELDTSALLSFVGSGSGFVTIWYDQVGSVNLTQSTASMQASIVLAGGLNVKNGKPAVEFSGSWYNTGATSIGNTSLFAQASEQFTTLNVFSVPVGGVGALLSRALLDVSGRVFYLYFNGGSSTPGMALRGGVTDTNRGLDDNLSHSIFIDWNGTNAVYKTNASTNQTLTVGSQLDNTQVINVGARTNGAFLLSGKQMELIVWDVSQRNNFTDIETNVKTYWGI